MTNIGPQETVKTDTLEALAGVFSAADSLVRAAGPIWTATFVAVSIAAYFGVSFWRQRQMDQGWERTLQAKDDMIKQINEQNRELRVQAFVIGKQFTKEEAVRLVYGQDRIAPGKIQTTESELK